MHLSCYVPSTASCDQSEPLADSTSKALTPFCHDRRFAHPCDSEAPCLESPRQCQTYGLYRLVFTRSTRSLPPVLLGRTRGNVTQGHRTLVGCQPNPNRVRTFGECPQRGCIFKRGCTKTCEAWQLSAHINETARIWNPCTSERRVTKQQ